MSDGNKRYLGDVFLNSENYERQKQFFRDVVESYQWKYGGSFDAATLQGTGPNDYATKEQGEKADLALLSPILLGKSEIANVADSQYIYTDAIKLDNDIDDLTAIEWYRGLENNNVTEALISIYDEVTSIQEDLQDDIDSKLSAQVYNNFISSDYTPLKNSISNIFETFTDNNDEEVTKFNADLVNGLRFRLITQDAYDELSTTEKNYWRNIFIIKDANDIPPEYVDPMTWKLSDGYTFRVQDGYLQVNNGISSSWKNICSLEEFVEGSNFTDVIQNFMENNEYAINETSILEALSNISTTEINNNYQSYPFLSSSLHGDFVKNILINSSSDNVTSVNSQDGFKTVNLDINTAIDNKVNPLMNELNTTINTEKAKLVTAQQNIESINQQISSINSVNSDSEQTLNQINNKLTELTNLISSTNTNINNLSTAVGKWEVANLGDLKNGDYQSKNYWNEKLGLAVVYFNFYAYNPASYGGEGWQFLMKNDKGHSYNTTQVKAVPLSNVAFTPINPNPIGLKAYISSGDGEIYVYNPKVYSKNVKFHINGHMVYKYSKIQ